jgi:ATP-dependent DNA helicase
VLYHGDKATREDIRKEHFSKKQMSEQFPIVVTSYEIIMNDRQFLSRLQWKFIIIDEGTPPFPSDPVC